MELITFYFQKITCFLYLIEQTLTVRVFSKKCFVYNRPKIFSHNLFIDMCLQKMETPFKAESTIEFEQRK